jgi:hypothetical protein
MAFHISFGIAVMKKIVLILVLLISVSLANAQDVLENNPTSLKWNQVNTTHFKIIFPKGFETQAQRMANTLQHIHDVEAKTLGSRPRKISVVLQNQSARTNGFVSMFPRRSEFYSMPSQNYNFLGNNDWLNLLAAHEYRHIVQYQHATRGFNRLLYYLFGNPTFAGMAQAAVPMWFWEGDAVATETAFTSAGRGRIPYFALAFKTNLLEGRTFNYHKQYLRSYKHFIPDHYVLGYHMVSYLRKRSNDPDVWGKITARSWNVPFIPFRFSSSINKESGVYVTQLYRDMAKDLTQQWQQEIDRLQLTPFEKVNQSKRRGYTDYLYPQIMDDGTIVALRRGIGNIEEIVTVGATDKKLFTPGTMLETGMISSAKGQVIWNEHGFDPRWRVKNFSLIKTSRKGAPKRIIGGNKERYNGSALSPDATRVATTQTNTTYQTSLVIIGFENNNVLKQFPNPDNAYLSMPRWTRDGKRIVLLKTKNNLKSVVAVDAETGAENVLVPASEENIGYPVLLDDYLLFNSPISGIDNIYAIDLKSNQRYQVTTSKYGAYNAAVTADNKTIYYNDQGRDGMDVVKAAFNPSSWKPFSQPLQENSLVENLVKQEGRPELFDSIPQEQFPVKKYNRFFNLINPYSWGFYTDNTLNEIDFGVKSRNVLNTVEISAGYNFDLNERTGALEGTLSYQGLYPIFDLQGRVGERRVDEGDIIYDKVVDDDTIRDVSQNLNFKWKEQTVVGGIRLPLLLTNSRFHSGLELSNNVGYSYVSEFRNSIDGEGRLIPKNYPQYFLGNYQDNGRLVYNHFAFSLYRLLKQSHRDIYSKWGTVVYVDWHKAIKEAGVFDGENLAFYATQYLPGLFKHHSFWGYWAAQSTDIPQINLSTKAGLDNYIFRNQIPLPRGLSMARYQTIYSMSGNYTLPLWYPDIAIGPLLNIQRLRANLFADYAFGSSTFFETVRSQTNASVGVEMKLDINILRFYPKFDIGFRYSYGQEQRTSKLGQQPTTGFTDTVAKFELLIGTFNF